MIKNYFILFFKRIKDKTEPLGIRSVIKSGFAMSVFVLFKVLIGTLVLLTLKKLKLIKKELVWIKLHYSMYDLDLLFLTYRIKNDQTHYSKTKALFVKGDIALNNENGQVIMDPEYDEDMYAHWKDYGSISTKIMEV